MRRPPPKAHLPALEHCHQRPPNGRGISLKSEQTRVQQIGHHRTRQGPVRQQKRRSEIQILHAVAVRELRDRAMLASSPAGSISSCASRATTASRRSDARIVARFRPPERRARASRSVAERAGSAATRSVNADRDSFGSASIRMCCGDQDGGSGSALAVARGRDSFAIRICDHVHKVAGQSRSATPIQTTKRACMASIPAGAVVNRGNRNIPAQADHPARYGPSRCSSGVSHEFVCDRGRAKKHA